jgi:hypothetical protein
MGYLDHSTYSIPHPRFFRSENSPRTRKKMSKRERSGASGILAVEADFQEKCGSGGLSFASFLWAAKKRKENMAFVVRININGDLHVQKIALMK